MFYLIKSHYVDINLRSILLLFIYCVYDPSMQPPPSHTYAPTNMVNIIPIFCFSFILSSTRDFIELALIFIFKKYDLTNN